MWFSQRIGKKPVKVNIQKDTMDDALRNGLWNAFWLFYVQPITEYLARQIGSREDFRNSGYYLPFQVVWHQLLSLPLHTLSPSFPKVLDFIHDWFFKAKPYDVYDFVEFVGAVESPTDSDGYRLFCNSVLEKELSAYRFVGERLASITSEEEMQSVEDALANAKKSKLAGVYAHLDSALAKLTDRKEPDYRNSIKESISAVESISKIISGNPKATLGKALRVIEDKISLHPSLKTGFTAIYGYTSDDAGIRHAMVDDKSKCDFDDAKYMLVSCSAFVNYLMMKAQKAGVALR
ncbi:MAG TPA: hypothetical protein VM223_19195 [Planctomycetota bacterium]|nr:hypothetical protein [Planctomycetota bacterium]